MRMFGCHAEVLGTSRSVVTVAQEAIPSLPDTRNHPFAKIASKCNISHLFNIAPLGKCSLMLADLTSILTGHRLTDPPLHGQNGASPHHGTPMSSRMDSFRSVGEFPVGVCRACGCGDNTIGHWTRWCVVPLMVVWIILQPLGQWQCLDDIATQSTTYNAICPLTVAAFRWLLRQEGAFYHQTPNEAKSIGWWIDTLLMAVAQDAPQELGVPFFRSIGMPSRCKVDMDRITMQRVPVDIETMHLPPLVCTLNSAGSPGDCVAILPACSTVRDMQGNPLEFASNASIQMIHCTCGEYHL